MFGQEMRIPLELVLPSPEEEDSEDQKDGEDTVNHFLWNMELTFRRVYALTREHLQAAVVGQKVQYDKRSRDRVFHPGQGVWLYNPRR